MKLSGLGVSLIVAVAVAAVFALEAGAVFGRGQVGRPSASRPCGTSARPPRVYRHVVWIVMENRSYPQVVDSPDAPYLRSLAQRCGVATNFSAVAHPSLPNYLALTSGSTQGISDDGGPSSHPLAVASIFSQLGSGWRLYAESMPSNCARANSDLYATKHNPAVYYTNIAHECAQQDLPLGSAPTLSARFTFVVPNLCHDMHDCSTTDGDRWLSGMLPRLLTGSAYRSGTTAVFITWDEGSGDNHIATLVVSPSTPRGLRVAQAFTHYSLLRTTEDLLGIRRHLGAAASAPSMRRTFHL